MKDILLDVVRYTHGLGGVELLKVVGTDAETTVSAVAEDRSVIVSATLKSAQPQLVGTFGMPNLSKLRTILGFEEYDATAQINVTHVERDGVSLPVAIHFETADGDFVNDYRLMSKALVEERVKSVTFKGAAWNVAFEPAVQNIGRLKKQALANNEETHFTVRTSGNELRIHFGEASTHSGMFTFATGINGSLSRQWMYPVKVFLAIMDMPGGKTVEISDQGAARITVDSGLAEYTYLLPAQSK